MGRVLITKSTFNGTSGLFNFDLVNFQLSSLDFSPREIKTVSAYQDGCSGCGGWNVDYGPDGTYIEMLLYVGETSIFELVMSEAKNIQTPRQGNFYIPRPDHYNSTQINSKI